jgi:hypothetical protein
MYNPKGNFSPPVNQKSEEEKEKIKKLISKIFMFKNLEEKEMQIIINAMKSCEFE